MLAIKYKATKLHAMNRYIEEARTLLLEHKEVHGDLIIVARKSGIGYEWIKKFADGTTQDPGVTRLSQLYKYLFKQKHGMPPQHAPI
jgi:hypothetical protein